MVLCEFHENQMGGEAH